jgi:hypothetical protein
MMWWGNTSPTNPNELVSCPPKKRFLGSTFFFGKLMMTAHRREIRLQEIAWHYTTRLDLPSILQERSVRAEAATFVEQLQQSVVWFSLNEDWEPMATKVATPSGGAVVDMRRETSRIGGGLVRIGVRVVDAPYSVEDLRRIAGVERETIDRLTRLGEGLGANPWDWRFSRRAVPSTLWTRIEVSDGAKPWMPYGDSWLNAASDSGVLSAAAV